MAELVFTNVLGQLNISRKLAMIINDNLPFVQRRPRQFMVTHLKQRHSEWLDNRSRRIFLLIAVVFLLSAVWGCTTQKDIEEARNRGARAGAQDGQSAGDAAGYNATFKVAEGAAYTGTLNQLYASGDFHRRRIYSLVALGGAFLLGLGVQYGVIYLLRRKEILYDIDRIILRKQVTEVDLTNLLEQQTPENAIQNLPEMPSFNSTDE